MRIMRISMPMPASIVSLAKAASSRFASAPANRALFLGTLTHVHSLLVGHAPVYFWSGIVSLLDVCVFAAVVFAPFECCFFCVGVHPSGEFYAGTTSAGFDPPLTHSSPSWSAR